ncbi:DUF1236 domain-containing protein [Methylobacterium marchantiae]|uniref:DUF1236 domain-containing protein n=1 Tax=Methylobacterium marchantiae TaxID=600331 RepID=A0ABW3X188_9HYPH
MKDGADGRADRGDRMDRDRGDRGDKTGRAERGGRGDRVAVRGVYGRLGAPQRTEFRQSVFRRGVPRLAAGAFALTVGAAIARSYTLYDLPPDIVRIAPEYEDYRYVLVDDDIVIVDPDTYEIVDVIRG